MSKLIYTAGLAIAVILLTMLIVGQQYDSWFTASTPTPAPPELTDGPDLPPATLPAPSVDQQVAASRDPVADARTTPDRPAATNTDVLLTGIVEPLREARIRAAVNGTLRSVSVEEGDEIRSGQIIARIDNEQLEQDVQRLQAISRGVAHSIDATKALHQAAAARLRMVEGLTDKRIFSEAAIRELRAKAEAEAQKAAQLEDDHIAAEKAVNIARAKLVDYAITAPFDGRVTHVEGFPNQFIAQGEVIAIVESHQKQLRVFVGNDFLRRMNSLQFLAQLPQGGVEMKVRSVVRDAKVDGQYAVILAFPGASWPWTGEVVEVKCRQRPPETERH